MRCVQACVSEPQTRQQIVHFALIRHHIGAVLGPDDRAVQVRRLDTLRLLGRCGLHQQLDEAVDKQGFSLHAVARCAADECQRLEQLCRYITRPVLANERVSLLESCSAWRRWCPGTGCT